MHISSLLLLLLHPILISAALHLYKDEGFYTMGDALAFQGGREGLFRARKTLDPTAPLPSSLTGYSFINLDHVTFRRPAPSNASSHAVVEILIFEQSERKRIGFTQNGQLLLCCTDDLAAEGHCLIPGRLIIRPPPLETMFASATPFDPTLSVRTVTFDQTSTEAYPTETMWSVHEASGMYYLWFVACDRDAFEYLELSGYSHWQNPHGLLPGMLAPLLPFYTILSLGLLALAGWWSYALSQHLQSLTPSHLALTGIVMLLMLESLCFYVDLESFNHVGFHTFGVAVAGVIVGVMRRTASRLIALLISMGYGVIRPIHHGVTNKLVVFGIAYACSALALNLVTSVGAVHDLTSALRLVLILPVAVLNAIWVAWFASSLLFVMTHLRWRRDAPSKLSYYRYMAALFSVYLVLSLVISIHDYMYQFADFDNVAWQSSWLGVAWRYSLDFGLVASLCYLLRPNDDSFHFTYTPPPIPSASSSKAQELIKDKRILDFIPDDL